MESSKVSLKKNRLLFSLFMFFVLLTPLEGTCDDLLEKTDRRKQILFLAQKESIEETFALYKVYKEELGHHDFEILQQMGVIWVEQSARSSSLEKKVLGLFGYSIAGLKAPLDILESAITNEDFQVQRSTLAFLGKMQEDYTDALLNKAMASSFLDTRLEAAYLLAERKSPSATGQIESLMYRLPPPMRAFFPEFFAIIGTSEAINVLRHLMDDPFHLTKIEAILSAARHGRDDLLPIIRAGVTHIDQAEQEACASALGYLKDMRSIKKLQKLTSHSSSSVQLAALRSLFFLGYEEMAGKQIAKEAETGNVFAIKLLEMIPGHENVLCPLLIHPKAQVRFNAALTLLHKKDSRSLPALLEFLIHDSKDLGFQPMISLGGSLQAWKVISSTTEHAEKAFFDIKALSLAVKEHILAQALELEETEFLLLAQKLLRAKQTSLIPALITLVENLGTPKAISLLKQHSQTAGAPLLRLYCNLALLRLKEKGLYRNTVCDFLRIHRSKELIRFRDILPRTQQFSDPYKLTPEENSALLISAYETLSQQQDPEIIDLLLDAIEQGHPSNRAVLAGILIHTLQ